MCFDPPRCPTARWTPRPVQATERGGKIQKGRDQRGGGTLAKKVQQMESGDEVEQENLEARAAPQTD